MRSKAVKAPTAAERERLEALPRVGCLACHCLYEYREAQVHHIVEGGRRIRNEHRYTIGLCPWHHESIKPDGWSADRARRELGPPLSGEHGDRREFERRFGRERDLLVLQDFMLRLPSEEHYRAAGRYMAMIHSKAGVCEELGVEL